jgi:hypothetical protein
LDVWKEENWMGCGKEQCRRKKCMGLLLEKHAVHAKDTREKDGFSLEDSAARKGVGRTIT